LASRRAKGRRYRSYAKDRVSGLIQELQMIIFLSHFSRG